ncbi:hypothetical protein SLA2020_208410 [Shorea laevis]
MEKEQQQQQQQKQHFHVLAVDDSLIDRKLLERLLKISSYQVTCVESGNKALEYLGLLDHDNSQHSSSSQQKGMKVNLIMTDYCMPGMSGYDLLKRVKKSSWKHIPVVVMSSENVPSRVTMCLEGGAEEFLLKPLQLSDVKKIQSFLLKSTDHSYTNGGGIGVTDSDNNNTHSHSSNITNDISTNDVNNTDNTNDDNSSSESNRSYGKRKAMSPEAPERRPKIKA